MPNAIARNTLGALCAWNSALFCLMMPLILLKTSSARLRPGEYGGRNSNHAPTWFSIKSVTPSTWWMDTLSRITTEWELTHFNGWRIGMRQLLINCSNFSPFTVPSIIIDTLKWNNWNSRVACSGTIETYRLKVFIPLMLYARFLKQCLLSHPLSSTHISIEGSYTATSTMNLALRWSLRCTVIYWMTWRVLFMNFSVLHMVATLIVTPNASNI